MTAPDVPSVGDRLTAAGIPPDRAVEHLSAGRVRVDGVQVDSFDVPAPPPARVTLWPA